MLDFPQFVVEYIIGICVLGIGIHLCVKHWNSAKMFLCCLAVVVVLLAMFIFLPTALAEEKVIRNYMVYSKEDSTIVVYEYGGDYREAEWEGQLKYWIPLTLVLDEDGNVQNMYYTKELPQGSSFLFFYAG